MTMPTLNIELMKAQAHLENALAEARAGLTEARAELAIFNLDRAEQDLAWPEGPPTSWSTLTDRARRFARQVESLELALTGADALAAPK
jgi:hypothetical protein